MRQQLQPMRAMISGDDFFTGRKISNLKQILVCPTNGIYIYNVYSGFFFAQSPPGVNIPRYLKRSGWRWPWTGLTGDLQCSSMLQLQRQYLRDHFGRMVVCFEYSPSKEIVVQTLQETPHQEFIAVFADVQCRKSHPPPCRLGVPRCSYFNQWDVGYLDLYTSRHGFVQKQIHICRIKRDTQ